ncbi:LacI family DNA-binding transcriptional regulator [Arthrobacter sp. H5]|uniref:LacI family DNA-binding transcriptional regulator n=1 Tax=Arthrobacter sp. H5 TaxID=1267973 RepID=UPI0004AFCE52|nr:LacI family DNA-binding transcriptional regulator [Arthrobacter sp. H5]
MDGPIVGAGPAGDVARSRRVATIYDVARAADVSHQTVSRLLKGGSGIRPENRARIEQALRELDYRPNLAARSLATNRSRRIGALVYELQEVGPSKIVQAASDSAREAGYLLDIVSLDPEDERAIAEAVALLAQQDFAGILAFAPTDRLNEVMASSKFRVPIYVETESDDLLPGRNTSLNGHALGLVTDHLLELGHSRLFHVAGPRAWLSARNRTAAYHRALEAHGLESVGTLNGDWSAASGYRAGLEIPLDRGVTAVVASNDQMALGVLRALSERGIAVPQDVSVVGFDDIPESAYFDPPLTTVRLDFRCQGRSALKKLLTLIGDTDALPEPVTVLPELVVRSSSSPAAGG